MSQIGRSGRTARVPIWPALALMALALILGGAVTWFDIGHMWDVRGLRQLALREGQSPDAVIALFQGITWAADAAQRSLVLLAFALWLFWDKRWRAGLILLIFASVAGATSSILKQIYARARPDIVPHLDSFSNLSFPSGHATNAMAILVLAALLVPKSHRALWVCLAVGVSLLVGLSRLALGVHWPSDVVGGLLWGAGFALAGWATAQRWTASR